MVEPGGCATPGFLIHGFWSITNRRYLGSGRPRGPQKAFQDVGAEPENVSTNTPNLGSGIYQCFFRRGQTMPPATQKTPEGRQSEGQEGLDSMVARNHWLCLGGLRLTGVVAVGSFVFPWGSFALVCPWRACKGNIGSPFGSKMARVGPPRAIFALGGPARAILDARLGPRWPV